MNQLKDVFHTVLETPAPPPPTRASMLGTAHAAVRRRSRRRATGVTAVAALAVTVVATPHWLTTAPKHESASLAVGAVAGLPHAAAPVAPEEHARLMLATLLPLLPPTVTTPTDDTFTDAAGQRYMVKGTQAVSLHPPKGEMVASTDVYRGDEGASASVSVSITGLPEPAGDLCATAEVLHQGADDGCKVVTASNGDRVRYSWRVIAGFGRIDYAARFHAGGYVVVHQSPGGLRPDKAPRTAGFWTEAQMVDAATTAAFWPTNLGPFTGGIGHPPRSR